MSPTMCWVPWVLLKILQMRVALKIHKAVLAWIHWNHSSSLKYAYCVIFAVGGGGEEERWLGIMESCDWVVMELPQSTKKKQLNCNLLWEVNVPFGIWKQIQAQETAHESPASFWPWGLKCRKRRSPGDVFAFCAIHLVAGERGKYIQGWALNGPRTVKMSCSAALTFGQKKLKGGAYNAFLAFQLGSPSSYHFNPINAEYTVRHGTKLW